jgi:hypothetical protein
MNSVLQTLFHLPALRRLTFSVEDTTRLPILRHLQQLFAAMTIPEIHSTDAFTTSRGWTDEAPRVQHDAVEFLHCSAPCQGRFLRDGNDIRSAA